MPPAARVADMHVCPMFTGLVPHVGGPILPPGCPTVLIGMMPAARVGDMAVCVGPPDVIAKGSMTVLIGGMPAARMGDMTAHGGSIVVGFPTVLIGEPGGGAISKSLEVVSGLAKIGGYLDTGRTGLRAAKAAYHAVKHAQQGGAGLAAAKASLRAGFGLAAALGAIADAADSAARNLAKLRAGVISKANYAGRVAYSAGKGALSAIVGHGAGIAGAKAGAAVGALGGPLGAAAGAVVGYVGGSIAGAFLTGKATDRVIGEDKAGGLADRILGG